LEATIRVELERNRRPGYAIAVVARENLVFTKSFGVANVETKLPVLPQEVSGTLCAHHLAERIFKPLEMTRTTFRSTMAVTRPFASGHSPEGCGEAKVIHPSCWLRFERA
jgi:CubicO group peptidase (beta-lactamase class C family)